MTIPLSFFLHLLPLIKLSFGQQQMLSSEANCSNVTISEKSIFDFFQSKEKIKDWIRPVKDYRHTIPIQIDFSLRNIIQVVEKSQEIHVRGYFEIFWIDQFRVWNDTWPQQCIPMVTMRHGIEDQIWTPSIAMSSA